MTPTTPPPPWAVAPPSTPPYGPPPGSPPPPVVPTPSPAPAGRVGRRILIAAVVVVALVAAGIGVGRLLDRPSRQYPAHWDARILPIVHFVERTRGLTYKHPVRVYFLTPAEYHRASVGDDSDSPDKQSRADAAHEVGELRALALLQGNPNLFSAGKDLADSGTLAFYDQDTCQAPVLV